MMLARFLALTLLLASGMGVACARKPHHKHRNKHENKDHAMFGRFKDGGWNYKEYHRGQYAGQQRGMGPQQYANPVCVCVCVCARWGIIGSVLVYA